MSERILLVDDEPLILEALRRQLRKKVDVEIATSGAEGLALIERSGPFAVVVSDMRMPQMTGSQFLAQVHKTSPDSVRMILSGQAELESTIAAVNQGQIFRFLMKPCSPEALFSAIDAGIEQYRLVMARRELLEKTLHGTVQVLTEILEVTNSAAQHRAKRVERYAQELCDAIGVTMSWELRLAAMLSQIGCVTLPEDALARLHAGQALDAEEQSVYEAHPRVAGKLLGSIPRLENVAAIVARQLEPPRPENLPGPVGDWPTVDLGALLLKVAGDLDHWVSCGVEREEIARRFAAATPALPKLVVTALQAIALRSSRAETILVKVTGLQVGMVLDEDLMSANGMRLLPKGQEITKSILARLHGFAESIGVKEPFRVNVAR